MSPGIFENAIIAALIAYFLFLLVILVEYITDKRARKTEISQAPGPDEKAEEQSDEKKDGVPEQWKHEEFE